jgi:hypothetical protein
LTVNVCPPIVSVPERGCVLVFAVALKLTEPLPLPLVALVIDSQLGALLAAVHAQPAGAPTFVEPVPPPAATA